MSPDTVMTLCIYKISYSISYRRKNRTSKRQKEQKSRRRIHCIEGQSRIEIIGKIKKYKWRPRTGSIYKFQILLRCGQHYHFKFGTRPAGVVYPLLISAMTQSPGPNMGTASIRGICTQRILLS